MGVNCCRLNAVGIEEQKMASMHKKRQKSATYKMSKRIVVQLKAKSEKKGCSYLLLAFM